MIFIDYLRISGTENTPGGCTSGPQGWRVRPPVLWVSRGSPPLIPAPIHFVFLQKNHPVAQTRILAHFATIFDLLVQSSICKTVLGDCSSVCDSSNVQLVFFLVLYILQIFAAVVTLFLSLHVKFIWSKVVLMHDIASRCLWE